MSIKSILPSFDIQTHKTYACKNSLDHVNGLFIIKPLFDDEKPLNRIYKLKKICTEDN